MFHWPRGRSTFAALITRLVVPTIVLHGERDTTVHPANAAAIVADALQCCATHAAAQRVSRTSGAKAFTIERHADAKGAVRVEHWTLHGVGHAWSGGSADGSHTACDGPDATGAMLRFFQSHRLEPRSAR